MFPASKQFRPENTAGEFDTNLPVNRARYSLLIPFIFAALAALPLAACCDAIMVGDIEVSPEDFSASLTAEERIEKCIACHGKDAGGDIDFGPNTHFGTPALRGMRKSYLRESLMAYKAGTRAHEEMSAISSILDLETIDFMARTFAAFEVPPMRPDGELAALTDTDKLFRRGQAIARQGMPQQGVPACMSCHGSLGEGSAAGPRLAGQNVMYIRNQFKAFASGKRQTPRSVLMQPVVAALTDEDIEAIAHYYESVSEH